MATIEDALGKTEFKGAVRKISGASRGAFYLAGAQEDIAPDHDAVMRAKARFEFDSQKRRRGLNKGRTVNLT